jgi:hypothetical protein
MREAQKMMQDPAFQAQMKTMTDNQEFKQHMEKSQEALNDPEKVKELEDQMQEKLKEGNALLAKAKKADEKGDDKDSKDDDKKELKEDDDKKEAAKKEEVEDGDADDMPDMPALNLN